MTLGFLVDKAHHATPTQQKWASGEPERSFWFGIRLRGRAVYDVTSYRCDRCGYLESYAAGVPG